MTKLTGLPSGCAPSQTRHGWRPNRSVRSPVRHTVGRVRSGGAGQRLAGPLLIPATVATEVCILLERRRGTYAELTHVPALILLP